LVAEVELKDFTEKTNHPLFLLLRSLLLQELVEVPQMEDFPTFDLRELDFVEALLNHLLEHLASARVFAEDIDHGILLEELAEDVRLERMHTCDSLLHVSLQIYLFEVDFECLVALPN
jgi:hypothetical protein